MQPELPYLNETHKKPLGERLGAFLVSGGENLVTLPEVGHIQPLRLSFQPKDPAVHLLDCRILNLGWGYLIIGERLKLTESQLLRRISQHNQDLANLSRELRQKNLALQDMMAQLQRTAAEKEQLIAQLQDSLLQVKTLKGLLPICASCKKIRTDQGYWEQIEDYLKEHSEAEFSHGICPACASELYDDFFNGEVESTRKENGQDKKN